MSSCRSVEKWDQSPDLSGKTLVGVPIPPASAPVPGLWRESEDEDDEDDDDAVPDPNDGGSEERRDTADRSFLDRKSCFGLRLLELILMSFMTEIENPDAKRGWRERKREE